MGGFPWVAALFRGLLHRLFRNAASRWKSGRTAGTGVTLRHSSGTMEYRFITPNRKGKWYPTLELARRFANSIGAGFSDAAGNFVAYRDTILEQRRAARRQDAATGANNPV